MSPTLLVSIESDEPSQDEGKEELGPFREEDEDSAPRGTSDDELLYVVGGQKYRVGPVVAQGGMGVVREAVDLSCHRPVAIKVMAKDHMIHPDEQERFVEEAQITSQLEHPNIVPVHELGYDQQNNVFYSMKYVQGNTLTSLLMGIRKGNQDLIEQFPLSRLLNIFQKVCDAIAFAHSKGVAHCDLKPDNIMICDFGEVLVMDWGLARRVGAHFATAAPSAEPAAAPVEAPADAASPSDLAVDTEEVFSRNTVTVSTETMKSVTRTTTGRIMGTPGFMAPERIWGSSVVDVRSDLYSLGATLYSILTLRAPIFGKDIKMVLQRILAGDIRPPVSFNEVEEEGVEASPLGPGGLFPHCPEGKIPGVLSDVAMKAMANDPSDRYSSVKEFQQDIEAYQNGLIWHLVADEDFSSDDFRDRWEVVGGQCSVQDGELRLMGGEPQILLFKKPLSGDIRIEFECHQESVYLNDISCFMASIQSANRREIPSSGYEFKFGAYDNSLNLLMRSDRRIWSESGTPLIRGKRYRVRAERIGSRLRLTVNNEDVFRVHDRDPLSGPDRTAVGLVGWVADTRYRHIRIYCLGTPWKSDILDLADRQVQKGQYTVAMALYKESMESFPDAGRLARARRGHEMARRREEMSKTLPVWKDALEKAWPGSAIQLRMDNDGLTLEVSSSNIEDLSPLRGLPLTSLYCGYNRITSLEPLRGMSLTTLNCSGNPIASLEPLRGMPLSSLICECCQIESLEPLSGLRLTLLVAGSNRIQSLAPLRGMPLTLLSIWSNQIQDISPLRGMPLTALYCNGNRIESLEALKGMPLVTVNCSGNRLSSLEPIQDLSLNILHCASNQLTSLEPLRGMMLNMLSCQNNRITNLHPLKGMPLGVLTCGHNLLTDVVPFAEKPPEDFLFDCDSIPTARLEALRDNWTRDFRFAQHARFTSTLLALRRNDAARLRELSRVFQHHRYLFIPKFLRWLEARDYCARLGGRLLTVASEEENAFVSSMFKGGCWIWMGLVTTPQGHRWESGEPVTYLNFMDKLQEAKLGPKIFSGRWACDDTESACNSFMVKWDAD